MNVFFAPTLAIATALAAAAAHGTPKILPSGDSVPENLLRIELVLDKPLPEPLDMSHVSLRDDRGILIADAFLDLPLANQDGRRIAILMHPGRVKTGVGPNRQAGLALRRGQHVTLSIADPQLPAPMTKSWRIEPPIQTRIDTRAWQLLPPAPGRRDPLQIRFPGALGANAEDLIAVSAPNGQRLQGSATLSQGEMHWSFVPSAAWKPGPYELRVHASLEDTEGNRMCSAFEQVSQSAIACGEHVRIAFQVEQVAGPRNAGKGPGR